MGENVDEYYLYNKYRNWFRSQKWRVKKIPTFKKLFAKFYINGSKEERKIIEKLFCNLICKIKDVNDINEYIFDFICNPNNNNISRNLAHRLQLVFILLYALEKIFKISPNNDKSLFKLIKYYFELGAVIFWKNNRQKKTCAVAIIRFDQNYNTTLDPYSSKEILRSERNFEAFNIKFKQIDNTFIYYSSQKIALNDFDSKYDTHENIEKNCNIIWDYYAEITNIAKREKCPWCSPFKMYGKNYKKCKTCSEINKILKNLNNLCPNSFKPFKDDYDISEQIIRDLRNKKTLLNSIEKAYGDILKKYEKNLNKIENQKDKGKVEIFLLKEKKYATYWHLLRNTHNRTNAVELL